MIIRELPVEKMSDMSHADYKGKVYLVKIPCEINLDYTFIGYDRFEALLAIGEPNGLLGFNQTHKDRPDDIFNPHNLNGLCYNTNNPQYSTVIDQIKVSHIDSENTEKGCKLSLSFSCDLYTNFCDEVFKGEKRGEPEEFLPNEINNWILASDYGTEYNESFPPWHVIHNIPYMYPKIDEYHKKNEWDTEEEYFCKYWPFDEPEPDYCQMRVRKVTLLGEPEAICIFDPDLYEEYMSSISLMRGNMIIKELPVEKMSDLSHADYKGKTYQVKSHCNIVVGYKISNTTVEQAKKMILSETGLIGYFSSIEKRSDDQYHPLNKSGWMHENNNPFDTITLMNLSHIDFFNEKQNGDVAEFDLAFEADIYINVPTESFNEDNIPVEKWLTDLLTNDFLASDDYKEAGNKSIYDVLSYPLHNIPYMYPGYSYTYFPISDYPSEEEMEVRIKEVSNVNLLEATMIYDYDEYKKYKASISLMR